MAPDDDKTRLISRERSDSSADADETRIIQPSTSPSIIGADDGEKTKLMRRPLTSRSDISSMVSTASGPGSSSEDPVVGWLIVVAGPGKGRQVIIGQQNNTVGRGGGDHPPRVSLDFGDKGIARGNAFTLRYDPRKRRFKILPGEGTNIVYLNKKALDAPALIDIMDVIEVSETQLLFMSLCSEHFDWSDTYKAEDEEG
ncbi:hypothetical protein N9F37_00885 [bacterium]|nr:hypothetical protein [Akkermansiaceae bacterium]MDA8972901.1 hypothetical protein [bacterium]MDA8876131.1 hypothetical protein [Akkermansiaceae bacterium]MDA8967441.1 hypothetical protein [Akkermansiaceae bacterium]MDB4462927.1 hypothetical protein [Akkermansiaceae bacterium]